MNVVLWNGITVEYTCRRRRWFKYVSESHVVIQVIFGKIWEIEDFMIGDRMQYICGD